MRIRRMIGCSSGDNLVLIWGPSGCYFLANFVQTWVQFWRYFKDALVLIWGPLIQGPLSNLMEDPLLRAYQGFLLMATY